MAKEITTLDRYDEVLFQARAILVAKNADYGESWREMRSTTFTDIILNKIRRIRQLEELKMQGKLPQISEGIESELKDILNYCVLALLRLEDEETR